MALQLKDGLDVKLVRNSSTGKYDLSFSRTGPNKGNPELEFSRTHAVLTSLLRRKRGQRPGTGVAAGGYYFDQQNRRGSLLWTIAQDRLSTPSQMRAYAEDAMQQLVERNIIQSYEVTALRTAPGKLRADVGWRDLAGKQAVSV